MARFLHPLTIAALILFSIPAVDGLHGQETRGPADSLFGVPLIGEARLLLREVEQLFGARVREEWLDETDGMSGKSKIDDDGVPVIKINPAHGKTTDVIVHELYHLKLSALRIPGFALAIPAGDGYRRQSGSVFAVGNATPRPNPTLHLL